MIIDLLKNIIIYYTIILGASCTILVLLILILILIVIATLVGVLDIVFTITLNKQPPAAVINITSNVPRSALSLYLVFVKLFLLSHT